MTGPWLRCQNTSGATSGDLSGSPPDALHDSYFATAGLTCWHAEFGDPTGEASRQVTIYYQSLLMLVELVERIMPSRNVNLTEELDRFVLKKVKTGRYENASEVVRAALRTLEREEREYEAKLAALRTAIDEGDASGIAEDGVFERVRETLKLPRKRR